MRIGIDGRALQGKRTGIGRYVFELCRELDKLLPQAIFYVYSNSPVDMPVTSDRWLLRQDSFPLVDKVKSALWLKFRCGFLCKEDNLDVFWGAATFLPHLPRSVRTVITVYDLNFIIAPETMTGTHIWSYRLFFKKDIKRADIVTAISKGTSRRLFEIFGRSADAIVYPALDSAFSIKSGEQVDKILHHYAIDKPYLLAVATWEPRKNLELLISTFLSMKEDGLLSDYKLVLVGGRGWKDQRLVDLLRGSDAIIPLGYVPDDHLAPLYTGAGIFIFPSIYEGFGMPVLEAISCGVKVVCTDIPEIREAGGDEATYIAPTAEGIRQGILAVLSMNKPIDSNQYIISSWGVSAGILASVLAGGNGKPIVPEEH
jgi:glycosyltransferase involved in cell wall biosynthesis